MQENWVPSMGWEDPLEKEMATHSTILAWKIPWTEKPDGLQSIGCRKSDMTQQLNNNDSKESVWVFSSLSIVSDWL